MLWQHELNVTVMLRVCYPNVMSGWFQHIILNKNKAGNLLLFFAGADYLYFTA